jgi:hypothetical protein
MKDVRDRVIRGPALEYVRARLRAPVVTYVLHAVQETSAQLVGSVKIAVWWTLSERTEGEGRD